MCNAYYHKTTLFLETQSLGEHTGDTKMFLIHLKTFSTGTNTACMGRILTICEPFGKHVALTHLNALTSTGQLPH